MMECDKSELERTSMPGATENGFAEAQEIAPITESHVQPPPPSAWRQLWIWMNIGIQSFGGGAATLYLIRRESVERRGWLSDQEYTRYWGICQIAPGINILGLVILIGWQLSGAAGAALALAGLLLPSAAITIMLTAVYSQIEQVPLVQAALRGVLPATVGLGLLLAVGMLRPLLSTSRKEGRTSVTVALMLLLGSVLVVALTSAPVVAVLWGTGALAALANWQRVARQRRAQ
jgi:chromate transporter